MLGSTGTRSRSPFASLATILVLAALVAPAARAFTSARPEGRFDPFVQQREGGVLATSPRDVRDLPATDALRVGWEAFVRDGGGTWRMYVDERTGRPTLASGSGLDWSDADGETTLAGLETRARSFLDRHRVLVGETGATVVLDPEASGRRSDGGWLVVFRQEIDGLPVADARFDFHVKHGRMNLFGSHAWGDPTWVGAASLTAAEARAALDAHLGVDTAAFEQVEAPERIVVPVDAAGPATRPQAWTGPRGQGLAHVPVWRLSFREPGEAALWIGEIDARDGRVVAFYDGAHYAAIRGGVFPVSPDGDCADGGCEIAGFPMPFVDYTEAGQSEAFADAYGNLACADPAASFETNLVGTYVEVRDECGPTAEPGPCDAGLELGLKAGENCERAPGASAGNTSGARSGYYQVNRVAEVARHYLPDNTWLQGRVVLNVNVDSTCNATWGGQINMYRAGNGCGHTAEIQGVVTHEWGHGFDQNDGGGYDNTSEAYADVVAIFAARDSCVGRGFFVDGTCSGYGDTCLNCSGIRDHDWAARQANTPATPQDFVQNNCPGGSGPCGYSVHCEGYPIGESIYDLATRDLPAAGLDPASAWQLAERLWYASRAGSGGAIYTCALPDTDSCASGSWFQQMRAADDDDGDLSNGTPHAAALYAAFARHNIACGLPEDPENQSTSTCPAFDTPTLTVTETEAGTELQWAAVPDAESYLVFRGELGCDRQQVPVATVAAPATSWLDDVSDAGLVRRYRVQAIGANAACRSAVSSCVAAPDGPRLQRNGSRIEEDPVNGNASGFPDPGETFRLPTTLFNSGVLDAAGVAGRLRVVDPVLGRALVPEASWVDIPVGAEAESDAPHFEVTLFDAATCGTSVELDLEMRAADAAPRTTRFRIPLGTLDRDFVQDESVEIPNLETVTSDLVVDQDRTLTELDVSVDINQFQIADLIVELTSPSGTTVRLHDQSNGFGGIDVRFDLERDPDGPGTMADFVGESTLGTWTLTVTDAGSGSIGSGTLVGWTLHATVAEPFDCAPFACPEPAPTVSPDGLTVDRTAEGDLVFDWLPVAGAAGYHVLQSTGAPFDGAVDLTGRTSGETTLTVPGGVAATPDLTFFEVRTVNACNEESP
jgi:subtilisin-like proprotein convertase family protein